MVAEFEFYVKQALVKKANKCLIVEETKKKTIKVQLRVKEQNKIEFYFKNFYDSMVAEFIFYIKQALVKKSKIKSKQITIKLMKIYIKNVMSKNFVKKSEKKKTNR